MKNAINVSHRRRPFYIIVSALHFTLSPLSRRRSLISSMAGIEENGDISTADTSVVLEDPAASKFGFERPEMYKENLSGTVNPYDRHVFLCYKTHEYWPSRVEDSDSDPLPKLFAGALKARKNDISIKTLLTICEGGEGTELSDGDVLMFPDMIKFRGLEDSNVDSFVDEVLVNGKPWASGLQELMTGSHIFVCAHNSRDKRCGVCGPALIEKFKEEIELRELKDQVFVSACSHVGGHKYAGNLIIFTSAADGKISGHWYGYVTPDDVPAMLDQHIGKGEIIEKLWRGQMGAVPVKEPEKVDEQILPNESVGSCCQGANGFSCCRDENSGGKQQGSKSAATTGKLSFLGGKWEQREFLTAAAVVGAVATVFVAYSLYKRAR